MINGMVLVMSLIVLVDARGAVPRGAAPQNRVSDPLSFAESPIPPIPIGIPVEDIHEAIGKPLTPEEFLFPPIAVDPPLMDESRADPIEKAGLFEGDIIVESVDTFLSLTDPDRKPEFRNAIKTMDRLWEGGIIPYSLSSKFDRYERGTIAFAMKEIHDNTCVRFHSREKENDYIHIIKADGCSSSVGKIGDRQVVSLGNGCLTKGVVIHELVHSLGFWHEQARPDRDGFIRILWENIQPGLEYNFGKYDWTHIQNLSVPYDLGSIMHYGSNAFAMDRSKPTIVPANGGEIGQRYGLSEKDILKINLLYNCSTKSGNAPTSVDIIDGSLPETYEEKKECIFWAKNGECQKNKNYMLTFCQNSCNKYGKGGPSPPIPCEDANSQCVIWAEEAQCVLNPGYMLVYCRQSCIACSPNDDLRAKPMSPRFGGFTHETNDI